ncbi:hypothetical protein D9M69_474200 [compost metagenome]
MLELWRQGALGQVPGDGRRHQDLHELRRLEADHPGNVDPASSAHGVVTHDVDDYQQQHADHITHRDPAGHEAWLELGDDDHRHQANAERSGLFGQQIPAFATGRIEYEQAAGRQGQQQDQQRAVDVQALQQRRTATHHILTGEHAIEVIHHGR